MRSVLPIVGGIIGAMVGAPQIGFMIGSLIGNAVDPQVIKGPSIGDGQTQTSREGVARPIIYGTASVSGNIIDRSQIYKSIKRTRQSKGGGPVTEEERMHLTYAIRICEGPIKSVLRIWEDEKLVYDIRANGSQVKAAENEKYKKKFRLYTGDEEQQPDPELEVIHGVGNAPSYRGTAYIVFPRNDVTDRRGSIPNYRFEVAALGIGTGAPAIVGGSHVYAGAPGSMIRSGGVPSGGSPVITNAISPDNRWLVSARSTGSQLPYISELQEDNTYSFVKDIPGANSGRFGFDFSRDGRFLASHGIADTGTDRVIRIYAVANGSFDLIDTVVAYAGPNSGSDVRWNYQGNKLAFGAPSQEPYNSIGTVSVSNNGMLGTPQFRVRQSPVVDPGNGGWPQSGRGIRWSSGGALIARTGTTLYLLRGSDLFVQKQWSLSGGFASQDANWAGNTIVATGIDAVFPSINDSVMHFLNPSGDTPVEVYRRATNDGFGRFQGSEVSIDGRFLYVGVDNMSTPAGSRLGILAFNVQGPSPVLMQRLANDPAGGAITPMAVSKMPSQILIDPTLDSVSSIVLDIADRMGTDESEVNTEEISDLTVRGFVIAQQYTGANALRSLQNTFFFDPSEYDDQIHMIKRGAAVKTVITRDDLTDEPENSERKNALEYPRKLELMYQNAKIGYDAAKATAERNSPTYLSSGEQTLEVPVVMNEDEAAQVADKQLKVAWAEAEGEVKISLPTSFDYLTPTDCIGLALRDTVRRLRIESVERADGVLQLTTKVDRQSAYSSHVTGIPVPEPTAPPETITGDTELVFLNIPAVVDNLDFLHYAVAGTGTAPAWYGALVQREVDGGEFQDVARLVQGATIGELIETVSAASEHYPDTTNTIQVQLFNEMGVGFEATNQENLLRENNAIAIARADGTAEILQYRDSIDHGDGLYTLSYLIRGRLNSGATEHEPGARVVLLSDIEIVQANSTLIGQTLTHRAVSYGQTSDEADDISHLYSPALSQTEFPIDLLDIDTTSDPGNIVVTWSPRERFGTDVAPVRSVNWDHYHVSLSDGSTTLEQEVMTPEATFSASGFTGTITATVSQVNRITGPGPTRTASTEV